MSLMIAELQAEIPVLQAEIPSLQEELEELRKQRSTFRVAVAFPKNNSPAALAEFHQHNAAAAASWIEQLKEIDRHIQGLENQIKQKQSELLQKKALLEKLIFQQQLLELELRVQAGGKRLQSQGQKINQLAAQLEAEILSFWAIYEEVNPIYCQWLQKPVNIVNFATNVIPHVYFQGNRFELGNKEIEWNQESEVDGGE
jgi:predicted  nucleic acid-binding Zn-ribbon protein